MRLKYQFPVIPEIFQFQLFYQHFSLKQKTAAPGIRTAVFMIFLFVLLENPYRQNQIEIIVSTLRDNHTGTYIGIEFHTKILIRYITDHVSDVSGIERNINWFAVQ